MAMNLSHQIGAMAGTPVQLDSSIVTGDPTPTTINASAVWRSPASKLQCAVRSPGTDFPSRRSPSPSPPVSPLAGGMRADLTAACQALAVERESPVADVEVTVREHVAGGALDKKGKGVPVYVMMPLDSVNMENKVNRRKAMNASLLALKSAGVEGIMMDVWWGLVEREGPGVYNWGGYAELLEMAKKHGLKVQAVMSFHQCGGNVGDSCTCVLSLPYFY